MLLCRKGREPRRISPCCSQMLLHKAAATKLFSALKTNPGEVPTAKSHCQPSAVWRCRYLAPNRSTIADRKKVVLF